MGDFEASPDGSPYALSVNLARPRPNPYKGLAVTGIEKIGTDEPVDVRAPGPKRGGLGSGLVGDVIGDVEHHGGDDQAVYAYAREDLDRWQQTLGRDLASGSFGENLTTVDLDVNGARIGERWRVGDTLVVQVTDPRIPCATFRGWIAERGWLKTFTAAAIPGAYLRVVTPGRMRSGDPITVVHRPDHDVSVALVFRALTREPELLPALLEANELPAETRAMAAAGKTFSLG